MKKVVVARSAEAQAMFVKCTAPSTQLIALLQRHPQFVNHSLTDAEITGDTPGYKTQGSTSLVRWTTDGIHLVVVCLGDARQVGVCLIEEFRGWRAPGDPYYEAGITKMQNLLIGVLDCGFTQADATEDDPFVRGQVEGFRQSIEGPLKQNERGYLAIVVMQGLGTDPFVRTGQL